MNPELENLRKKASNLPLLPGVYIMLDSRSEIIYIGKAKKLKNRVSSYFHGSHLPKVAAMADKVRDFNVIIAESEFEALVLENSLIKRHKPHYNILLKDDKGYPFVRIDMRDPFPRLEIASRASNDGAKYFGPYGGRGVTGQIIESVSSALLLPRCRKNLTEGKTGRPCLHHHLGECDGWCTGAHGRDEYITRINQAEMILEGRSDELLSELREKMEAAAEELRFEYAASLRDRIKAIEGLSNRQRVISTRFSDTDAIAYCEGAICCFSVLHFAGGDLTDKETFIVEEPIEDEEGAISEFVLSYYSSREGHRPGSILIQSEIEDREVMEQLLSENNSVKVHISVPKRGESRRLLEKAFVNAEEEIMRRTTEHSRYVKTLELLRDMLCLPALPSRIEAFDVSNLGDTGIVSAMTVFVDGKPLKKDYRKFRIRDVDVRDDYASMHQSVLRRFRRYVENDGGFSELPDLLLIDGGQMHAKTAEGALSELGISTVPVFGMVKDDRHRTRALMTAEGKEIGITGCQSVYSLIGKIQEETHRFAIEYQRSIRDEAYASKLDGISGIGEKRKETLIRHFKSMKKISEASAEELSEVIPKSAAEAVYSFFHNVGEE